MKKTAISTILGIAGLGLARNLISGSKNKENSSLHPSQVYGGRKNIFSSRKHYSLSVTQPTFFEEFRKHIRNDELFRDMKQLFIRDRKARQTFESILSDFYLRPKYWLDLLHSILLKDQISMDIPDAELSPTVLSQFWPEDTPEKALGINIMEYSAAYGRRRRKSKQDIFNLFEGKDMFNAANRFYRQYIGSTESKQNGYFFWLMILHSVINDLASKTTMEMVNQAQASKLKWYKRNLDKTTSLVEAFFSSTKQRLETIPLEIDYKGQTYVAKQRAWLDKPVDKRKLTKKNAKIVASEMLKDALDNYLFGIKIKNLEDTVTVPVVSGEYTSMAVQILEGKKRIANTGKQKILSQAWIDNFINGRKFNTFTSSLNKETKEIEYQPVEILFGAPMANITIQRTNKEEAVEWIAKTHNMLQKFPSNGLLDIIGAYDFEGNLMGIMTLNSTHSRPPKGDAPGQYHIVMISRIAVSNDNAGREIAVILTNWAIENKELYNRSAWTGNANVVSFSMLQESGKTYARAGMEPTRLVPPGEKSEGSDITISNTWKIKWESNPVKMPYDGQPIYDDKNNLPKAKWWIPKLHRAYVKWSLGYQFNYSRNCWNKLSQKRIRLENKDIQGLIKGTDPYQDLEAIKNLVRVCGYTFQQAKQEIKIIHNGSEYSFHEFSKKVFKNQASFESAKPYVLQWINSQKRIRVNAEAVFVAEDKICGSKNENK
jgi:hypothetical protein